MRIGITGMKIRLHKPLIENFTAGPVGFVMSQLVACGAGFIGILFYLGMAEDWNTINIALHSVLDGIFGTFFVAIFAGVQFITYLWEEGND